jgi:threonine synthase
MDIQVASNFERFIYFALGGDSARVRDVMATFKQTGRADLRDFNRDGFSASRTDDAEIGGIIRRGVSALWLRCRSAHGVWLQGPESGPGEHRAFDGQSGEVPETIRREIGVEPTHPSLEALKSLPIVKHRIRATEADVKAFIDHHAVRAS